MRIGFGTEGTVEDSVVLLMVETERTGGGGGGWKCVLEEGGGNPSNKSSAISVPYCFSDWGKGEGKCVLRLSSNINDSVLFSFYSPKVNDLIGHNPYCSQIKIHISRITNIEIFIQILHIFLKNS